MDKNIWTRSKKVKSGYSSTYHHYGKSHALWDPQCYLLSVRGNFPPSLQLKLVLDLATPEKCKAVDLGHIAKIVYSPNNGHLS